MPGEKIGEKYSVLPESRRRITPKCRAMMSEIRARSLATTAAPIATEVKGLSEKMILVRGNRSERSFGTRGRRLDPPAR